MKIVNLTTAALELTGGVLLAPAGGRDESRSSVAGFTPGPHEEALAQARKIAILPEAKRTTKPKAETAQTEE